MAKKAKKSIKIGDLVSFDRVRRVGIVIDTKEAEAFHPNEDIRDIKVLWDDGAVFWCLDFTLEQISALKY